MTEPTFRIEPLAGHHNRQGFDCGNEVLNRFLQHYASQWARRNVAQTYVIVDAGDPHTIVGYYSVNATRLDLEGVDIKGLPQSAEIGAVLLGRLAVAVTHQRQGVGTMLLLSAFELALDMRSRLGLFAMIVDAIDDEAAAYYERWGFIPFSDNPRRLYFPLKDYVIS